MHRKLSRRADPRSQLLPFAFAKRHGVLINGFENGRPLLLVRQGVRLATVSEVRRFIDAPLCLRVVAAAEFDRQLQQTYERESNTTMQMVDGLGEDTDLFQRRPGTARAVGPA